MAIRFPKKAAETAAVRGASLGSDTDRSVLYPRFEKLGPIFTLAQANVSPVPPSIYWPSLFDASVVGEESGERWRIYYSTDHATETAEHVRCAVAAAPEGPYTDMGQVYKDSRSATYSGGETPSVYYQPDDPDGKPVYLYYHVKTPTAPNQETYLVRSADGLTGWTSPTLTYSYVGTEIGNEPHGGYMRASRIGDLWVGTHLAQGGSQYAQALSYSKTGRKFTLDHNFLGFHTHLIADADVDVFTLRDFVAWQGQLLAFGMAGTVTSGTGNRFGYPAFCVMRDERTPVSPIMHAMPEWGDGVEATGNFRTSHVTSHEGRLYVTYQIDNTFYLARSV
jgi:hypothetical protein